MNHGNSQKYQEFDSCAIVAFVKKDGIPTHGNVRRTLMALDAMEHRTGEINYESDGAGIQTDIPRKVWQKILAGKRINASVANDPYFAVAHLMIADKNSTSFSGKILRILDIIQNHGFDIVYHQKAETRPEYLGPKARENEPIFYQIACLPSKFRTSADTKTFYTVRSKEHTSELQSH